MVRARQLSEHLNDDAKLVEALLALAMFRLTRHEFGPSRELAERALMLAEQAKAPAMLAAAHSVLGLVMFSAGRFGLAREHLERSVALFGSQQSRNFGEASYKQPAAGMLAASLVSLGYPSTGLGKTRDLLAVARQGADPPSITLALFLDAMNHLVLRNSRTAAERGDEMLLIATEHGMQPHRQAQARFFRGRFMAETGRSQEGFAEMRRAVSDPAIAETPPTAPMLSALAEAYGSNGEPEEGLMAVIQAEQTGDRTFEAEFHRVKGELLRSRAPRQRRKRRPVFAPRLTSPAARRPGFSNCAQPPASRDY